MAPRRDSLGAGSLSPVRALKADYDTLEARVESMRALGTDESDQALLDLLACVIKRYRALGGATRSPSGSQDRRRGNLDEASSAETRMTRKDGGGNFDAGNCAQALRKGSLESASRSMNGFALGLKNPLPILKVLSCWDKDGWWGGSMDRDGAAGGKQLPAGGRQLSEPDMQWLESDCDQGTERRRRYRKTPTAVHKK
jgi:hypothetical protein